MKFLRLTLLTLSGFVLLYSCKKEKSLETGGTSSIKAEWEFKENKVYKGKVDTAYIEDFGTAIKTLFFEGTSQDGKQLLSIEVVDINTSSPGTYKTPNVLFQYLGSTGSVYGNDITAVGEFTVVITKIDSVSVSGTFTGKVKDSINQAKAITEGKFTAKLKNTVVTPPPVGNGQLTFWAKSSCTAGGNIAITLSNSQTGIISTFSPTAPAACGATGMASFTLAAGSYTWKAKCGSQDSTSGTITVAANQCIKQEVFFSPPTDCHISDIAFYDFTTNLPLGSIHSLYNASNKVSNVQVIDSVNGTIDNNFVLTYPAGKVQIDGDQYFLLDGSGRVSEFHGYEDPADNTADKVIIKYTYDAGGYMSKYTLEYVDTPGVIKWQGVMQYTNGNLVKLTENDPSRPTTDRLETTYDYNTSIVKNFLYLIATPEITYFQSAINAGKTSQNAVKTETIKSINPTTGAITGQTINNYDAYTIDPAPNQYVRNFKVTTVGDPYSTKFVLSYKCF